MKRLFCRVWVSKFKDANEPKVHILSFISENEKEFENESKEVRKIWEKNYKLSFPYLYIIAFTEKKRAVLL